MQSDPGMEEISEINMTPFVDIVLVILVIFMATATFVAQGKIPVSLPKASAVPEQKTSGEPAIVTIEENGRYHFNDIGVSIDGLQKRLDELNVSARQRGVVLRSDAKTPFSFVVSAIDACKKSGISTFAIQTEREQP